jgi:hypothetical protein
MSEITTLLNCVDCREFTEWEVRGENAVNCKECGKKHHDDSLHPIYPDREYERDDRGRLIGTPP